MLTSADVAKMRATAGSALPDTCVLMRNTLVSDGGGGYTETFAAGGTVSCRLSPQGGVERELGDRITPEADWVITLPPTTFIETDDRIMVAGGTFDVVAVRARANWEITRRVDTRKVT